jgi:hypothetical protein
MSWLPDYSFARPGAATIQAAGGVGAMRYTGSLDPQSVAYRADGAVITADEVADFNAHSLPYGLVLEYEATWILRGYQSGHDLAAAARAYEASIGIPAGVTYAACDFDIQPPQYAQALATMQGMADAYGGWQYVRPYGSKAFCEWVQANSPARGSWSTYAWSFNPQQGRFEHAADARLWQYNFWPIAPVQGCDFNEVLGDWGPRNSGDDLTPDQDNILRTCAKAIVQLAGALNQHINDESTFRQLVIHGDPTHYGFDQLHADIKAIEAAVKATPGGGTDLQPILDRLNSLTLKAS